MCVEATGEKGGGRKHRDLVSAEPPFAAHRKTPATSQCGAPGLSFRLTTTMFATRALRLASTAVRATARPTFLRTKRSTNLAGLDIHPDPLPELESTYTHTLHVLKALPETGVFRQSAEAVTQLRLDIVKANMTPASREDPRASEEAIDRVVEAIDCGLIEEIVDQAHDEFELATKMIDWKPYVPLSTYHAATSRSRCLRRLANGKDLICRSIPARAVTRHRLLQRTA